MRRSQSNVSTENLRQYAGFDISFLGRESEYFRLKGILSYYVKDKNQGIQRKDPFGIRGHPQELPAYWDKGFRQRDHVPKDLNKQVRVRH